MEKEICILKNFRNILDATTNTDCSELDKAIAELEEEQKRKAIKLEADYKVGAWLSAALEDKQVCDEFKNDITFWFEHTEIKGGE